MKYFIKCSALALFFTMPAANAAFIGGYDLANWILTINGGSIDIGGAPDTLALVSSNDASGNEKNQDITIAASQNGTISFHWIYQTADDGSIYDPFGYLLNSTFVVLSQQKSLPVQFGDVAITVSAGDSFGFRINSTDSENGAGQAVVSAFSAAPSIPAPVPLPAAVWLFGSALFGFLWRHKHRTAGL